MVRLVPFPFGLLVTRLARELAQEHAAFDLPAAKHHRGLPGKDLTVRFQGERAGSPLGPAAGPHTQMAQNLALSWLAGARILELKTVQILDQLTIPRPCIDMRTVGFNAEWSQELKLEESLEEYVKGAMLIVMLRSGELPGAPFDGPAASTASTAGAAAPSAGTAGPAALASPQAAAANATLFDMSVGYDLAGIRSGRVRAFIDGMRNARPLIDRLRRAIPPPLARLRELDFPTCLSSNITLSTFHGCPPDEIERIVDFLLRELQLNCVVKLNPMLLGKQDTRRLLHDVLGYRHLSAPDIAFDRDLTWGPMVEMLERLDETARACGLHLGVKFTNTLVVENDASFLPAEAREVYLSGPPLHVLAMELVRRYRAQFGDRFGISFSAGIDRHNFPDAAALGLLPITTCTDLLKPGGYGRLPGYYKELGARMDAAGATTLDEFVLRAYGQADAAWARCGGGAGARPAPGDARWAPWVSQAKLLNTEFYAQSLLSGAAAPAGGSRYVHAHHAKPPRKIGRHLQLFDCISCDKCIPVCPNDALFAFRPARGPVPKVLLRRKGAGGGSEWQWIEAADAVPPLQEEHQIGVFADFCNECGNCDVFCPEDGGPYAIKPRFFGSRDSWERARPLEGLFVERADGRDVVLGRAGGREYRLEVAGSHLEFAGGAAGDVGALGAAGAGGFRVRFQREDPRASLQVDGRDEVDLTWCFVLDRIRQGVLEPEHVNYVNAGAVVE